MAHLAVAAVAVATVECGLFLASAAIDRADATDGAGPLELGDLGVGAGRAVGWSPVVAGLAVWGAVVLFRRAEQGAGLWKPVLVTGLAVVPLAALLVAGIGLPVFPRTALTVAAGWIVAILAVREPADRSN